MAALSILVLHTAASSGGTEAAGYGPVLEKLTVGVTIFFVLSGFLLYRPFFRARYHEVDAPRVRDYARRRVLRIVPAYWVALTVLAVWVGLPGVLTNDWWRYYGFFEVYSSGDALKGLSQGWSLAVEASFYAALPIYAIVMSRLSRGWSSRAKVGTDLAFLATLALISIVFRKLTFSTGSALPWTVGGNFDWFAIGMGLAVVSVGFEATRADSRPLRFVTRRPGLCWLAAGAVIVFLGTVVQTDRHPFPHYHGPFSFVLEHLLYGVAAFLFVLPAVFGQSAGGLPRRLMRWPVLAWLGLISYGIFLWHVGILIELQRSGRGWHTEPFLTLTAGTLVLTVTVAAVSYYLIERPILRFKDLPRRRRVPVSQPRTP